MSDSGRIRFQVVLWAEIAGQRLEIISETTLPIGPGHCPELAREIFARPMAQALADSAIKTGWEVVTPAPVVKSSTACSKISGTTTGA